MTTRAPARQQARQPQQKLLERLSDLWGLDETTILNTVKNTLFRPGKDKRELSLEDSCAALLVAERYGLDPYTKELHITRDNYGGLLVIVGVDGWMRAGRKRKDFRGHKTRANFFDDDPAKECFSVTCTVFRDGFEPLEHTEYMRECRRDTGPWKSHPIRMLTWKAIIQTYRQAFGLSGAYDPDEAERILAAQRAEIAEYQVVEDPPKPAPPRMKAIESPIEPEPAPEPPKPDEKSVHEALWSEWSKLIVKLKPDQIAACRAAAGTEYINSTSTVEQLEAAIDKAREVLP